ncbi:chorismate mutase [Paracoccus sp. p4-l81]|uniref:chorismate mutase n=1 Tax=Paracoccus sp. p4-l81 TaxID=3342806 RepID=UPI0035B9C378
MPANMAELRGMIDALDDRLIDLLAERQQLIDHAIRLKRGNGLPARIDARVEEVAHHVARRAAERGLDPQLIDRIWRQLMDHFIAREAQALGETDDSDDH